MDIRERATIANGGTNARLDIGANMRRKSGARRLRRTLNMGVDVSRCCDRLSIFPVGRSIIIYTTDGAYVQFAQSKIALTIASVPRVFHQSTNSESKR